MDSDKVEKGTFRLIHIKVMCQSLETDVCYYVVTMVTDKDAGLTFPHGSDEIPSHL